MVSIVGHLGFLKMGMMRTCKIKIEWCFAGVKRRERGQAGGFFDLLPRLGSCGLCATLVEKQ